MQERIEPLNNDEIDLESALKLLEEFESEENETKYCRSQQQAENQMTSSAEDEMRVATERSFSANSAVAKKEIRKSLDSDGEMLAEFSSTHNLQNNLIKKMSSLTLQSVTKKELYSANCDSSDSPIGKIDFLENTF